MPMSLKLKSAEEFEKLLEFLANDLFQAKVHFTIFWEINRLAKKHKDEMSYSPVFWQYTFRAHADMTLMRVIRIYDQHSSGFHLLRLLNTIQANSWLFDKDAFLQRLAQNDEAESLYQGIPEAKQLRADIDFVSEANPRVKILKKWRDEIVFHKDPRHLLSKQPFEANNALLYSDLSNLIEEGGNIVNRYAGYFRATHYGNDTESWKDVDFIFEALNNHPDVIEHRKDV